MDVNDARVLTTVISLILFVGIVMWAWSKQRRAGFEEAALLPFHDAEAKKESAGEPQ